MTLEEIELSYTEIEKTSGGFVHDKGVPRIRLAEAAEKFGHSERAEQLRIEGLAFLLTSRGNAFPGHFQPIFTYTNGATHPSREYFTQERLEWLAKRAGETSIPYIAAHFADVCWDLSLQKNPSLARLACDKYLEASAIYWLDSEGLDYSEAIERAVELAASIKDNSRLLNLFSEILSRLDELDRRAEYRYALELADALEKSKESYPCEAEQNKVLGILAKAAEYYRQEHPKVENSFGPVEGPNEHFVRSFTEKRLALAKVWGRKELTSDAIKLEQAQSYEREANRAPNSLAKLVFLKEAEKLYGELGEASDVSRIRVEMTKAGVMAQSEMKEVRAEIKIEDGKVDEYISPLFGKTISESLQRLATTFRFIPDLRTSTESALERQKEYPLQTFFPKLVLKDGHIVGSPSSREELLAESVYRDFVMGILVSGVFRGRLLGRLAREQGLSKESLQGHFRSWGYCKEKHLHFLGIGFDHYFKVDYISAIHILVPQFEDILRWFFEQAGEPVSDPQRGRFILLDSILKNERFLTVAGPRLIDWYKLSLSDPSGLNLRNDVVHGLSSPEYLTKEIAELVIQLLLSLTRFTLKENLSNDGDGGSTGW